MNRKQRKRLVKRINRTIKEGRAAHPYPLGEKVVIRTVTMHFIGRLVEVMPHELVLTECSWLAESGRWSEMFVSGTPKEVEPFPDGPVIVGRAAVIDCAEWRHALPRREA